MCIKLIDFFNASFIISNNGFDWLKKELIIGRKRLIQATEVYNPPSPH